MQTIRFYAGEDKHVRLMIHATNQEPFIIRKASWELLCAGVVEAEGDCVIEDHVLDAKICPEKRTSYQLKITYYVADEKLIEQLEVKVT